MVWFGQDTSALDGRAVISKKAGRAMGLEWLVCIWRVPSLGSVCCVQELADPGRSSLPLREAPDARASRIQKMRRYS